MVNILTIIMSVKQNWQNLKKFYKNFYACSSHNTDNNYDKKRQAGDRAAFQPYRKQASALRVGIGAQRRFCKNAKFIIPLPRFL